jgi:hypothetical protein
MKTRAQHTCPLRAAPPSQSLRRPRRPDPQPAPPRGGRAGRLVEAARPHWHPAQRPQRRSPSAGRRLALQPHSDCTAAQRPRLARTIAIGDHPADAPATRRPSRTAARTAATAHTVLTAHGGSRRTGPCDVGATGRHADRPRPAGRGRARCRAAQVQAGRQGRRGQVCTRQVTGLEQPAAAAAPPCTWNSASLSARGRGPPALRGQASCSANRRRRRRRPQRRRGRKQGPPAPAALRDTGAASPAPETQASGVSSRGAAAGRGAPPGAAGACQCRAVLCLCLCDPGGPPLCACSAAPERTVD